MAEQHHGNRECAQAFIRMVFAAIAVDELTATAMVSNRGGCAYVWLSTGPKFFRAPVTILNRTQVLLEIRTGPLKKFGPVST